MKSTRNRIIAAAVILLVLVGAWFFGGNGEKSLIPEQTAAVETDGVGTSDAGAGQTVSPAGEQEPTDSTESPQQETTQGQAAGVQTTTVAETDTQVTKGTMKKTTKVSGNEQNIEETSPTAASQPEPTEPQNAEVKDIAETCTLSVTCETILSNLDHFNADKLDVLPKNGVILPATKVTFYEGESVFHVLQREMKQVGIQMEFKNTPLYNSAYIEGIDNIYELDCGDLSGWMYRVNGWFPNYGCSRYQLQDGDVIQWVYTCDLGRDVGGDFRANTDSVS